MIYFKKKELTVSLDCAEVVKHVCVTDVASDRRKLLNYSLIRSQMQRGGGVLYVDTSPEHKGFGVFHKLACQENRSSDVRLIDIENADASHSYNPLFEGDNEAVSRRVMSVLSLLEETVTRKEEILKGVRVIVSACLEAGLPLSFQAMSLYTSRASALEELYGKLSADKVSARTFKTFLDTLAGDDFYVEDCHVQRYFGESSKYLDHFCTADMGKVLNSLTPDIVLSDVLEDNLLLYVSLPYADEDDVYKLLGRMVLSDLCRHVRYRSEGCNVLNPSFICVFDDVSLYSSSWLLSILSSASSIKAGCVFHMSHREEMYPEMQQKCGSEVISGDIMYLTRGENQYEFTVTELPDLTAVEALPLVRFGEVV